MGEGWGEGEYSVISSTYVPLPLIPSHQGRGNSTFYEFINIRSLGKSSSLLSSALAQTSAQAIVKTIELKHEFAGLVGEMMFDPEIEAGSLTIGPILLQGRKRIKFARK